MLLCLSVPIYDAHCALAARSCLAPEVLFLLSTSWTSVGFASLSLRSLKVGPSKMPLRTHKPTQTQQPRSQQTNPQQPPPPITNPHNLKDENGDEVQAYSQNEKVRYTSVCELFQARIGDGMHRHNRPLDTNLLHCPFKSPR